SVAPPVLWRPGRKIKPARGPRALMAIHAVSLEKERNPARGLMRRIVARRVVVALPSLRVRLGESVTGHHEIKRIQEGLRGIRAHAVDEPAREVIEVTGIYGLVLTDEMLPHPLDQATLGFGGGADDPEKVRHRLAVGVL